MIAAYACTLIISAASLVVGRAILALLGGRRPAWVSGATGFAALVVVSPFLLRLPGRATTAAVILALAVLAAAVIAARDVRSVGDRDDWLPGAVAAGLVLAAASLPFLINDRVGVLGEGVYTNDHAAQLYWADWLQHGFGPEPSAVRFGYPIGPQALTVIAAQVTGANLVNAFNGLLLAIPALTALTALGGLTTMPRARAIGIAALTGLPYLAASFFAQSAFKETAMALFVLAFALALQSASRVGDEADPPPRWRVVVAICLLLGAAAVFTFSLPGLAWFLIAAPLWLVLEAIAGRNPVDWGAVRAGIAANRLTLAVAAVIVLGVAVVGFAPARDFVSKIGDVQNSAGRLSSPVFPGEAFSIWPAGDFRIVRGQVDGALLAVALGALAAGWGAWVLVRRRQLALLAMLITGGAVYVGTRAFAEIHVQAKALIIVAPLILFVALRGLLEPRAAEERRELTIARLALGVVVAAAAALSTLLALRDAPIGFDGRRDALEQMAAIADGKPVAFLGVDRFSGYALRGTLARAPAGYVPEEIEARPEKTWQQGLAADFDSLDSGQLDKFAYAITTDAVYQSTAPPNFEPVLQAGDYTLWKRDGETPRTRVLDEGGNPGATLDCNGGPPKRRGTATVLPEPAVASYEQWNTPAPPAERVAGQERGWQAPGTATIALHLPQPGQYALSLQYHSQVPLEVLAGDSVLAELPASLEGMYLSGAGRGAFWPAGTIEAPPADVEITVRAADPGGIEAAVNARRLVWLGDLAASRAATAETAQLAAACGRYVDHFAYFKNGGGG